jgi:hypothetical protein
LEGHTFYWSHAMPWYAMPRQAARWLGAAWVRSRHLPLHGLRLWTEAFHDRSPHSGTEWHCFDC